MDITNQDLTNAIKAHFKQIHLLRDKINNKTNQYKNKLKQQKTKTANNAKYYEGDSVLIKKKGKDQRVKRGGSNLEQER